MTDSIVELQVRPHYRLYVKFNDGVSGVVDLSHKLSQGVFKALKDPRVFSKAHIEEGAVTWPNGVDLAPDAMHDELIQHHGLWIVE